MLYSYKIEKFFKKTVVEFSILGLIVLSLIFAILSILFDDPEIEFINLVFIVIFWIEMVFRFFSKTSKKQFFKEFYLDMISIVPWEMLIPTTGLDLNMIRLLRLVRIIRIIRLFTMSKSTAGEKLAYLIRKQIEKSFSKQVLIFFSIITFLVFFFGGLFHVLNIEFEQGNPFWFTLLSLLGADSLYTIPQESAYIKIIAMIIVLLGILIFNGIFIAIIVSKIQQYFDDIKEGKGKVVEKNHLVILGWNNLVPYIIQELNTYCQTEKTTLKLAVMTASHREEIIVARENSTHLDVIYRIGESYKKNYLEELNVLEARSILIFCDETIASKNNALVYDSFVVKTYVSLYSIFQEHNKPMPNNILNFMDVQNAKYIQFLKKSNTINFNENYYASKFLSLICLNPQYFMVFNELISYEGAEFHFIENPKWYGKKFAEIMNQSSDFIPIGFLKKENLVLLPEPETIFEKEDKLLILSEDALSAKWQENYTKPETLPVLSLVSAEGSHYRSISIVGINHRLIYIIDELSKLDIEINIYGTLKEEEFKDWLAQNQFKPLKNNAKIKYTQCFFRNEEEILSKINLSQIDILLLIADESRYEVVDITKIDSNTIFNLLKIMNIFQYQYSDSKIKIISEIIDPDSEDIIKDIPTQNLNYVIGTIIMAKLLSITLLDYHMLKIYNALVQKGGVDLAISDIDFQKNNEKITFKDLKISLYEKYGFIVLGILRGPKKVFMNPQDNFEVQEKDSIVYMVRSQYQLDEI